MDTKQTNSDLGLNGNQEIFQFQAMDTKQRNSDLGLNENFERLDIADGSGSDTSFDFCWDVKDVKKNVSAGNLSEPKSEGSASDFDLCDLDVWSVSDTVKSSKANSSGTVSESEPDDVKSNFSGYSVDLFCDKVTILPRKKMEWRRKTSFSVTVPDTLYHELLTDQQFKMLRVKEIVQEHALPFLPGKSLARFRSVSKEWDRWIKNPFLAHKQSYSFKNTSGYFHQRCNGIITYACFSRLAYGIPNSFFDSCPKNMSIMSSCNGLLLCRAGDEYVIYYICNPATNEWKELPPPSYYHGENPSIVLAFEPSILNMEANYHVVCAFQLLEEQVQCFEIYSSDTDTWKCVDTLCAELGDTELQKNGFYYNGVAYWKTTSNEVLAFDLKNEVHGVLALLDGLPDDGTLSQMKGQLSYVCTRVPDIGIFEISVYMAGVDDFIQLEKCVRFEIEWLSDHNHCRVLSNLRDDVVMLLIDGGIYACNLINQEVEELITGIYLDDGAVFLPYVNSLVTVA